MTTSVTADDFLAALTKWGLKWRFYKTKADFLTHNRNGASNNVKATPGGFGPLRGVVAHNTASTAQAGMIDYLYRGDGTRLLPGPLATAGILKTGEVVLLGWGTTNATGPGDPVPDSLVRKNAMPLDREIQPTTSGPGDGNAILYAPYYIGFEACYASEGPTATQYQAMVRFTCAALDAMGGPANGYGAGSVVMHRELTTTRSDPQGVGKAQLRRDVAAQFKAGPPKPPTPPAPTPTTEWSDMATKDEIKQAFREVLDEPGVQRKLAETMWTNPASEVVYDVRDTDTPTTRVTPSTLLEAITRRVRPAPEPPPAA